MSAGFYLCFIKARLCFVQGQSFERSTLPVRSNRKITNLYQTRPLSDYGNTNVSSSYVLPITKSKLAEFT